MRASRVFQLLVLAALVATFALAYRERVTAAALAGRLAALRRQEQQLTGLRAEHDHLREQILAAAARSRRNSTASLEREAAVPAPVPAWSPGEWRPAAAWSNEGRSTPGATVATLLWAAVGGDLAAMQTVLEFDDATRAKARAWFDSLPPATRSLYASPEDLVASVTIRNIPATTAQLNWLRQTDPEHTIVGLLLTGPATPAPESAQIADPAGSAPPPSAVGQSKNQLAVLDLHGTPDGWRVIVPATAVDRMAKLLSAPAVH